MKVLIVANDEGNPFVTSLERSLRQYCDVTCNVETFYDLTALQNFDIVHIHWPEILCDWMAPTRAKLDEINTILSGIKGSAKLVVTKHNSVPHIHKGKHGKALYDMVYSYADGIIHLGQSSFNENFNPRTKKTIIPHGTYNYPNEVSFSDARYKLDITDDKFVVLIFGAVRTHAERKFLYNVARRFTTANKVMLIPRWEDFKPSLIRKPFQWLSYQWVTFLMGLKTSCNLGGKFVKENEVQYYFNASNIVLIPRTDSLNSGVLILAYSFGKCVIGPKMGNIGDILARTNNLIFEPSNWEDCAKILNNVLNEPLEARGKENKRYADENWSWEEIGEKHYEFYKQII